MSTIDGESGILPSILVNGVHVAAGSAAVKANAPASTCYTFTAAYTFALKGTHYSFRKGSTYSLAADVKTALLAASAPMTAA